MCTSYLIGDIATGNFAVSSAPSSLPSTSVSPSTPVLIAASEPKSVPLLSDEVREVVRDPRAEVRPYVKRQRVSKKPDDITEIIREIVASQEKFRSRATTYDKVIQIYQDRFRFNLSNREDMAMLSLFAENPNYVTLFYSFNDEQRDIFIQEKKSLMQ